MTQKSEDTEFKRNVIREWNNWAGKHVPADRKATGDDAMIFFQYLQHERSELLGFKAKGDRWQIIHGWLLRERKVTD
jgi:hypothetical protein